MRGRVVGVRALAALAATGVVLVGSSQAIAIVTRDGSGTHATTPGQVVFPSLNSGLNVDGVGQFLIDERPNGGTLFTATGSLLYTGSHIITCAHLFTDSSGNLNLVDGAGLNKITYNLAGGDQVVNFTPAQVSIHPQWDGNLLHGNDVAIVTLDTPVNAAVPRYGLYANTDGEFAAGATSIKVGYGRSGQGNTGSTLASGTKRAGLNRYESKGLNFGGFQNVQTMIMYDFDNGQAANDAFGFFFGSSGIVTHLPQYDDAQGLGDDEVGAAPGDSGGPTFLFDGTTWKIAGITSFGYTAAFTPNGSQTPQSPDIDFNGSTATQNSSFGEFGYDTRMTESTVTSFIAATVPEPCAALSLLVAGGGMALRVRLPTRRSGGSLLKSPLR